MKRTFLAAVAATLLMVGCAQTDASHTAAPVSQPSPQAAVKPSSSAADKSAPSPLLSQPGNSRIISGGSVEVCLQQCERSYQICMDGTAARADTTSGTMYEGRLFGPAARCESSLSSCLKRCNAAAVKK